MNLRNFMDKSPSCGESVFVDHSAVVIGDVTLDDDVSIWPNATIRGDVNFIQIGARSNLQDNVVIHVTHPSALNPEGCPVRIGEEVTVGHRVILHGCTLESRCLIGMGAILLDGVIVEEQVLVAAGTVVPPNKRLKRGYIYAGNPMRQLRVLTANEMAFFQESAMHYVALKNEYLHQPE